MALIDDVIIRIKAGNGGDGGKSFHQNYGSVKRSPDGGSGGRGGDIYFTGTSNLNDLSEFRYKKVISAPDGEPGMNKNLDGRKGESITVLVPLGTTLINTVSGATIEILDSDNPVLVAQGGRGQTGNHDQRDGAVTRDAESPDSVHFGEEKELHLILNLIADIGLIGLPNAGKSSLLRALTAATPKIGNYPFTTLEPNLGTIPARNASASVAGGGQIVLADIPGLVEGASRGKGLGIQFLKHIQKTKILFHCIDALSENAFEIYQTVRNEFKEYNPEILEKEEIILLTKIDLVDTAQLKKQQTALKKTKRQIIPVSIYNEESINHLRDVITSSKI